jgi:hypothetical protein
MAPFSLPLEGREHCFVVRNTPARAVLVPYGQTARWHAPQKATGAVRRNNARADQADDARKYARSRPAFARRYLHGLRLSYHLQRRRLAGRGARAVLRSAYAVHQVRAPWRECDAGLAAATKCAEDAANMTQPDIKSQIAAQLYTTLERLGADEELLAIVGSMNDTVTDKEVLRMLEEYNSTGNVSRQPQ